MAAPSPQDPNLPQDINALMALRDRLGEYLAAVERNTDAVNAWLSANRNKVILFYQQLDRALNNNDEVKAISLVSQMGDVAGFVLSLQDFRAKAETAFGKDNAFQKAVAAIADSLPAALQEPLPKIFASEEAPLLNLLPDRLPVEQEEQKKWWSSASGWFNREEKKREEHERELRRRLRVVKAEILGLQSDRHYYIDSFMDWVADTMAPETFDENGDAPDTRAQMLQYLDPVHIIGIAHADYREAVESKAKIMREAALEYSRIAGAIDRQDMAGIKEALKSVCPVTPTQDSELLKKLLLDDYQSASLNELILKHVKSRAGQAELLSAWLCASPLAFSDAKTPLEIFEKFVQLVLDKTDPLPPAILSRLIPALNIQHKTEYESLVFPAGARDLFQRVTENFADDLPAQEAALGALLSGMNSPRPKPWLAAVYVSFCEALRRKDAPAVIAEFQKIEAGKFALEICSLWHMCNSGASLLETIHGVSSDPPVKAALLEHSLQAGLLGEFRIDDASRAYGVYGAASKFKKLMQEDVLSALDVFPVDTARRLIAHAFSTGGLDLLRDLLTHPSGGWLEKVVSARIPDQKKSAWIAAFLEPFPSDIVRANTLDAAARNTAGEAAKTLSLLEKNMIGENVPLTEDKILCHRPHIANIWYNSDSKTLHCRMRGAGRSVMLLDRVSQQAADEILSLLRRRVDFLPEQYGLFMPENIDSFHHGRDATSVRWYPVVEMLGIDAATVEVLQKRADFIHVTDPETGDVSGYNLAGVCLLQKLEDGSTLLINKYGMKQILNGDIRMNPDAGLIDLDANVKFNPDNASLIRWGADNSSFEFRIESVDFDRLLAQQSCQFFYPVAVKDAAALSRLKNAIDGRADIHAPDKDDEFYFNMGALGYLALNEKASAFCCKRYSSARKTGMIRISHGMAQEVLDVIGAAPGVIRVGNLLAHENSIDDAYYNVEKRRMQLFIGSETLEVSVSVDEAFDVLTALAKNRRFRAVTSGKTVERGEMPTDVVNIDRVMLLAYDPNQDSLSMTAEDQPFPVNMSGEDIDACFGSLEEQGLAPARVEAQSKAWTRDIKAVLSKFPVLAVRVAPFISLVTPQILLQQLLGQATAGNTAPAKKLKDEFTTATPLPAVYEKFIYPRQKKPKSRPPAPKPRGPNGHK